MATGRVPDLARFSGEIGRALRHALIAGYGPDTGSAAAVRAIAWGAQNPDRLDSAAVPVARLHRIGRRRARAYRARPVQLPEVPEMAAPWIEPSVPQLLLDLARPQRVALLLRHGFGWSEAEVARILGVEGSAIRSAADAGMTRLRAGLDTDHAANERALHHQIAAYAEVLDTTAPQLDELIAEAGRRASRTVRWQAGPVLTAFVAALLVISVALVLRSHRDPTTGDSADEPTTVEGPALPAVDAELVNRSAVTPEMFANWEHQYAGPGAVTVVDGKYHMLSAAYGGAVATVAHAVSDDGVVWRQAADFPVLDLSEAPWAPREFDRATPRSVIVDGEGTWQLFFDISWFDRGTDQLESSIGRVVAPDPSAAWIYDSEPIIRSSDLYPWMADGVASPSVAVRDGGLVMLFIGEGPAGGVVGSASSQRGAVWRVRPEPVYTASGGWDGTNIELVDLVTVPGGMAMFYAGDSLTRRGLAVSVDGVSWTPHPGNPVLTAADAAAPALFDSEFVAGGGNVMAYVEAGRSRGPREVVIIRLALDITGLIASLTGG